MSIKRRVAGTLTDLGLIQMINELRGIATLAAPSVFFRNIRYRLKGTSDGMLIPPSRLIYLVAGTYDMAWFLELGGLGARAIHETLARNGLDINGLEAILDMGCGCGRVIRHFSALKGVKIYGCDFNHKLVNWCAKNLTFAKFETNQLEPPLPYASNTMDLVYALSVFTHWGQDLQFAWMDEMRRIIKPGGHLLMTTHGASYLPGLDEKERGCFHAGQLVVRREHLAGRNICTAFCSEPYVRRHLTRGCEIVDFVPEGAKGNPTQDLYLLRFA